MPTHSSLDCAGSLPIPCYVVFFCPQFSFLDPIYPRTPGLSRFLANEPPPLWCFSFSKHPRQRRIEFLLPPYFSARVFVFLSVNLNNGSVCQLFLSLYAYRRPTSIVPGYIPNQAFYVPFEPRNGHQIGIRSSSSPSSCASFLFSRFSLDTQLKVHFHPLVTKVHRLAIIILLPREYLFPTIPC